VPPDQIVNLRDKEATRDKIIATFKGLPDHPRINHQDPILIYYSGMSEGGDNSGLTPVDYADGQIPRISPRTLAALISGISKKHGNNIVSGVSSLTGAYLSLNVQRRRYRPSFSIVTASVLVQDQASPEWV
jgi:hypothetical protein